MTRSPGLPGAGEAPTTAMLCASNSPSSDRRPAPGSLKGALAPHAEAMVGQCCRVVQGGVDIDGPQHAVTLQRWGPARRVVRAAPGVPYDRGGALSTAGARPCGPVPGGFILSCG